MASDPLKPPTLIYKGNNAQDPIMEYEDNSSNTHNINTNNKRGLSSPPYADINKRYLFEPEVLITKNPYYSLQSSSQENSQSQQKASTSNLHKEPTKPKIPPIFLMNGGNYQEIIKDIKKIVKESFTTVYKVNQLRIDLGCEDDYRKLTKFYEEQKAAFHTFQNPDDSNLSVIIRNIPISITEDEMSQELLNLKYPVIKSTRLLDKNKVPMPLFAIELQKTEQAKAILSLDRLFHCVVNVEPRRKSSAIPQCTRCQRPGHTKNYCYLPPRCVKCPGNHHYSDCNKAPEAKPICVNCGGEHTANYRGCNFLKRNNHKSIPQISRKPTFNSSPPPTAQPIRPNTQTTGNITANPIYKKAVTNVITNPSITNPDSQSTSSPANSFIPQLLNSIMQLITPYIEQIKNFFLSLIPMLFNGGK